MKTLPLMLVATLSSSLFSADELTGDTKLACEAILCLSTGQRPSECQPSLNRYFSISAKKWKDTVAKRKSFLQLCPADSSDAEYVNLRDNILPNADPRQCTPSYLNSQVQSGNYKYNDFYNGQNNMWGEYNVGYRINPSMPSFCRVLIDHQYTDLKLPRYICSGEFYSAADWRNGYKLIQVNANEYRQLPNNQKHSYTADCGDDYYRACTYYFKKIVINKTCWTY